MTTPRSASNWPGAIITAAALSLGYQVLAWSLAELIPSPAGLLLVSGGFVVVVALGISRMIEGRRRVGAGLLAGQLAAIALLALVA